MSYIPTYLCIIYISNQISLNVSDMESFDLYPKIISYPISGVFSAYEKYRIIAKIF